MRKSLPLIVLLSAVAVFSAASYQIKKLPAGSPAPGLDGNIAEWPLEYFVDSLTGDSNAYAEARVSEPWTRADFQMRLYCAYDDTKIYYVIQVVSDDVLKNCITSVSACDNIKLNQLGKGTAMYIFMNGTQKPNPSCPWTNGSTFWSGSRLDPSTGLPTYEFALDKETTAPFGAASYQLSPGTEETDNPTSCDDGSSGCNDQSFLCVGANGPANKHDWASNPWDNAQYWPTWILSTTDGPAMVALERSLPAASVETLNANPNPFTASTTLSYKAAGAGALHLFGVDGKLVKSFNTRQGSHALTWNGLNNAGTPAAAGVYFAHLRTGDRSLETRIFLNR